LQDPPVNPLQTTTYFVEVFDQYNTIESSVEVVVSSLPDVQLGNDILTCPFDTVVLAVDFPGMDYYWSNGTIGNSISVASTGIGFDVKQIWVEVTNADNCVGVDTVTVTFDFSQCFGVGEEDGGIGFILYPNPATERLYYRWQGLRGHARLEIIDLHGRRIAEQDIGPVSGEVFTGSIDISGQPEGVYTVKLTGGDHTVVRKIILR
jgi:hypothetical protein